MGQKRTLPKSFGQLNKDELAFLEAQTGFDVLKGYIKDYDRSLMAHYAEGRADLGTSERVAEMAEIANSLTKEGVDITNLNSRVNLAYNKYRLLPEAERAQIQAAAYVLENLPGVNDGEVAAHRERISDSTDRARRIFEYLRTNGRDFKVEKDENPGQIRAALNDDTRMQVRALDANRTDMIGRVHRNGKNYYYQFANTALANSDVPLVMPTEFVTKRLEFALGESVGRYVRRDYDDGTTAHESVPSWPAVGVQSDMQGRNYYDTYVTKGSDSHSSMIISAASQIDFTAKTGREAGKTVSAYPDVRILVKGRRSAYGENFTVYDSEQAQGAAKDSKARDYLTNARRTAKANFVESLGVGAYDAEAGVYDFGANNALDYIARTQGEAGNETAFELSDREQVADVQSAYMKTRSILLGHDKVHIDSEALTYITDYMVAQGIEEIGDTPEEVWREGAIQCQNEALAAKIEAMFGAEGDSPESHLGSFNGANIAAHMTSNHTFITNEKDLQRALKLVEADYELLGGEDDFESVRFNDGTITFDSQTARSITPGTPEYEDSSEFWQRIADTTDTALRESGVTDVKLSVDENGIIEYNGAFRSGQSRGENRNGKPLSELVSVTGHIGQVFEPVNEPLKDDGTPNPKHGLIPTAYKGSANSYIAAGYTAHILDKTGDNADKSLEERTRCRGYEQVMHNRIKSSIRDTIIGDMASTGTTFDKATDLNYVYRHLYADKLSFDFEEQMQALGRDPETINALVKTQLSRVRYDSFYGDETNILRSLF